LGHKIIVFDYQKDRSGEHARRIFGHMARPPHGR
jgi:hypothetical protein